MRREIVIAGFGGQGIILMGVILAKMAEYFPHLQVAQAQSYGPVSRGGACRTDVVFSDREIHYPKCIRPDLMVFMSVESVEKYLREADAEKSLIVYDNTLISSMNPAYKRVFAVPATKIAEERWKNRIVANMFLLGAILDLFSPKAFDFLKEVVRKSVPKKSEDLNLQALAEGNEFGKKHIARGAGVVQMFQPVSSMRVHD